MEVLKEVTATLCVHVGLSRDLIYVFLCARVQSSCYNQYVGVFACLVKRKLTVLESQHTAQRQKKSASNVAACMILRRVLWIRTAPHKRSARGCGCSVYEACREGSHL